MSAILLAGLLLAGCKSVDLYQLTEEIVVSRDIELHRVAEDVWVHTTYSDIPGVGRYPANGLVVVDGHEVMLIALPQTDRQTSRLLEWIEQKWGITATTIIPIDFRDDSAGGLSEAHHPGVVSHVLDRVVASAKRKGLSVPPDLYAAQLELLCRKTEVTLTYLGTGDTIDNVVAWTPQRQVFFGGPLVKSLSATALGTTQNGDLEAHTFMLQALRQAYREAKVVVPGRGDSGGLDLIDHTLSLYQHSER
jgi:metallo-beta-lactamase class B